MSREPLQDEDAQSSNLTNRIFIELRRQILKGELAPGERLPGERELAQKYDTNRNTLREAVRRLEQLHLVTVRHGQGVTVADFRRSGTLELVAPLIESGAELNEVTQIAEDILPLRLVVMEYMTRLAVRRATNTDHERLQDITELLVAAYGRGDRIVIAHGFHRWIDALVDSSHSLAIRWVANPFLELYRKLIDKFPTLWLLDPAFPDHLRTLMTAFREGNEEAAIATTRSYYERIDGELIRVLAALMSFRRVAARRDESNHEVPVEDAIPSTHRDEVQPAPGQPDP
ncbi:MAG TPA: GntR family transcriptional regulator [Polyangiaceae bacterium]|nr:GntR family transcriptional regulator [Polyangiaceae bacterium]